MGKQFRERIEVGKDENGVSIFRWATGKNKRELLMNVARVMVEYGLLKEITLEAKEPKKKTLTVKQFINEIYIPTFVERLGATTAENYRQYINNNIVPFMGSKRIDEVDVSTIQQFYDWMATARRRGRKKNLNKNTIERVGGLTRRIFKVAVEMGVIDDNPVKHTLLNIHAEEGSHHKALPDEEVRRIKRAIPLLSNRDERIYMGLLVYTGMRPEEVRGLCWENINLEKQYAMITQAVTYPTNSQPSIGKPKTNHSARTVLLPTALIEILKPCAEEKGYICGGKEPWCYSRATRTWKRAFANLGLEGYCNYDFRTTYGTQLKEAGVSSAIVADLMGHADTRMVETIYAKTRHEGVIKQLAGVETILG